MRIAFAVASSVALACRPTATPPRTSSAAEFELLEAEVDPPRVESWTHVVPVGARYSLVDLDGWIGDVQVSGLEPHECDHCATHRAIAHSLGRMRASHGVVVALGPLAPGQPSLSHARVITHRAISAWWNSAAPTLGWTEDLTVDVDGDGDGDLSRDARGPLLSYRIRRRAVQYGWRVIARWSTPYVLDVEDSHP